MSNSVKPATQDLALIEDKQEEDIFQMVPNWTRNTSRMYTVTLLIYIICRVHHAKCLDEYKLESRFLGEISITLDTQMTPPL